MSQLVALKKTVRVLKKSGRLTDEHAALLAIAEGMAEGLDNPTADDPNTAAMWKEYRAAVSALMEVAADVDSASADVVALVRTPLPPALGNTALS